MLLLFHFSILATEEMLEFEQGSVMHTMSHNHCLYITFYPFAFLTGAKLIMFAHLSLQNRQVANKVRFERTPLCTVSLLSHLATGHFGGFWYYNVLALFRITVVPILAKSH